MPDKKAKETKEEQSARFIADAQRLIDDGKLNPTEAQRVIDKVLRERDYISSKK